MGLTPSVKINKNNLAKSQKWIPGNRMLHFKHMYMHKHKHNMLILFLSNVALYFLEYV